MDHHHIHYVGLEIHRKGGAARALRGVPGERKECFRSFVGEKVTNFGSSGPESTWRTFKFPRLNERRNMCIWWSDRVGSGFDFEKGEKE